MSCCPTNSWGELKPDPDYKDQGTVENLDGLNVYKVGEAKDGICILWNYDIFGFDSGRTRQLCDIFASKGFLVVMPDWYDGVMKDPSDANPPSLPEFITKHTQWDKEMKTRFEDKILPYAKKHGGTVFGTIGCCWGTYPALKMSAYPEVKACVGMHPSHSPIAAGILKENESDLLEPCKGKAKVLFFPAGSDHENVKTGGLAQKILGEDSCKIIDFPEMEHGWTTRGDLSDAKVKAEVERAVTEAIKFFEENVK